MTTTQTDKPLTFTQFKVLKAIPRGLITMKLAEPGTWRHTTPKGARVVSSSMRPLIALGLVTPDSAYTGAVRGCRLTAAGYAALSRAGHNPPKKSR